MHKEKIEQLVTMIEDLQDTPGHGPWVDVAIGGLRTAKSQLQMDQDRLANLEAINSNEGFAKK